jgi:signal peptidase I
VVVLTAGAVVAVLVAGGLLWLRRSFVVVTVDGNSMRPTFRPADRVLVRRRSISGVRAGQIVVVERPVPGVGWDLLPPPGSRIHGRAWYIKRAVALPGEPVPDRVAAAVPADQRDAVPPGRLVVLGDHPNSDDSKQWGYFPADRVLGVVVRQLTAAG